MSASRRVVVTGMGTVSAAGIGGADTVRALLARRESALRPLRAFDTDGLPGHLAGEVDDDALDALFDRDAARRLSRICRFTVAACRLAVEDARVDTGPSLGLVVGTEYGDFRSSGEFATGYLKRGPSGLSPMLFPGTVMNAMGAAASIAIGAKGPTVTVNQATVAGEIALARGAALVARGHADAVLAGGVDELCGPVYQRLAHELGVLSPMRKPDGRRDGVEAAARTCPITTAPCSARARRSWCWKIARSPARAGRPFSPSSARRGGETFRWRRTPRPWHGRIPARHSARAWPTLAWPRPRSGPAGAPAPAIRRSTTGRWRCSAAIWRRDWISSRPDR
jgi:hypothetical protein